MKEKNGEHPFGDAGQLIALGTFFVVWIVDSFFLRKTTFLSVYVPLYLRIAILLVFALVSVYLIKSGHVVVDEERRADGVVSHGAFRYVRHPLYMGSILFYVGLSISTLSLASVALTAVIVLFYNFIASYEEKLLEVRFGQDYRDYRRATGKWLPRLRRARPSN